MDLDKTTTSLLIVFGIIVFICLVILLVILAMRRIDTSKSSHLGLFAKLSYLCGCRIPQIELLRYTYVPLQDGERSKVLVVSFAGGALKIGGLPQIEFSKTLDNIDCDQLFLVDPTGMSWYLQDPNFSWDGVSYYGEILSEYCEPYEKVLFVGNCMGATGALMFGRFADRIIAFKPHIDPPTYNNKSVRLGCKLLPANKRADPLNHILTTINNSPDTIIDIYVSNNPAELQQIQLLPDTPNVTKHIMETEYNIRSLKSKGELVPLIQSKYNLL